MFRLPADAPVDLRVGTVEEFSVAALLLVVAVATTVLVLRGTSSDERRWFGLFLVGSAFCIAFEPALASVGGFWYATVGQKLGLMTFWGVTPGIHMLFAYYIFLGVAAVWIVRHLRSMQMATNDVWRLYAKVFVLAVVLELPVLYFTNIYTYYGVNQPFFDKVWFPLPLWYPVLNATLPFCMAAFALMIGQTGHRWHLILMPFVMPAYLFAVYFAQAWPVLTAMNSSAQMWVGYVGGIGTMALSLIAMHFLSLALPRLARSAALPAIPVAGTVETPRRESRRSIA
jgi:hypothetical protein